MKRCPHSDPIIPMSAPPGFRAVQKPDIHAVYHFRDVFRYLLRIEKQHTEKGEWADAHQASRLRQALLVWCRIHFGVILD